MMELITKTILWAQFKKPDSLPTPSADANQLVKARGLVLGIMGSVALLIIVIAGLQYVLSQGEPGAVAKAKNTIIYAVVGLAIAATAYSIVAFVAGKI